MLDELIPNWISAFMSTVNILHNLRPELASPMSSVSRRYIHTMSARTRLSALAQCRRRQRGRRQQRRSAGRGYGNGTCQAGWLFKDKPSVFGLRSAPSTTTVGDDANTHACCLRAWVQVRQSTHTHTFTHA